MKRLHRAYGEYQRELPPYTKRPSREEILTENLCDLPFFFRGPATRRLPPAVPKGSDLRMRRSPSRTANRDRGSLKESNPLPIKRPPKGKTSIRKSVFFGKFAKPRRSHGQGTRIIIELGMPVQDAFDALLIMNLGRFPSWVVLVL